MLVLLLLLPGAVSPTVSRCILDVCTAAVDVLCTARMPALLPTRELISIPTQRDTTDTNGARSCDCIS
jgi:hypothetical protein